MTSEQSGKTSSVATLTRFLWRRPLLRLLSLVEASQVRRLGRSALALVSGVDVLVLHTVGRRSGVERDTVLSYVEETDGSLLVVGGAGGQSHDPDWVHNARAEPLAAVTVDRHRFDVRVVELDGDERSRVWSELVEVWPRIDRYERHADRTVPVFRLVRSRSTTAAP